MTFVRYIDKTAAYYRGQGYDKPYGWAQFDTVPFAPLTKPLADCRVTLVSTSEIAVRDDPAFGDAAVDGAIGAVYSIPTDTPPERLYSRTDSFDRYATSLDDPNAYFPVTRLLEAAAAGRIGGVTPRLHALFNSYSQRKTREADAPEVLRRCREDGADVAVLVPV